MLAALDLWNWDAFVLSVRRSGQDHFQSVLLIDTINGERRRIPNSEYDAAGYNKMGKVLSGEPFLINREDLDPVSSVNPFGNAKRPSASLVYAPIMFGTSVVGIVSVQSYQPGFFDLDDKEVAQSIAEAVGPALERCRAEQRLSAFSALGHKLSSVKTSEEAARIIARIADELIGWDAFLLELYSSDLTELKTVYMVDTVDGLRTESAAPAYIDTSPSPMVKRILEKGPQLILRTSDQPDDGDLLAFGEKHRRSKSLMFVPLHSGETVVGMMSIQSYRPQYYNQEDIRTLQALADHCGGALERTRAEARLQKSEAELRALFHAMKDVILVIDEKGRYQFTAAGDQDLIFKPEGHSTATGLTFDDMFEPERAREFHGYVLQVLGTRELLQIEYMMVLNGSEKWFMSSITPIDEHTVLWVAREITERKIAEAALRESEERYSLAIRAANDGLWDWDLKGGKIFYSARWKSMLGCAEDEIGDCPSDWFSRVHPDDQEELKRKIEGNVEGGTSHFEHEHRIRHKDGKYRWMLTRGTCMRNDRGTAYRMAGSQSDITVRKSAEEQLIHGAYHDALTGLPNRAYFMECLARAVAHSSRRENYQFAVLFLDLDRFKVVNDSLGHLMGDRLLVEIARRLEECIRPGDAVARLGGDEFTVLLDDIKDASDAIRVADRIQRCLQQSFALDGNQVFTSASIGIALSSSGYDRPEDILRDTDMAMYRAKASGKACHVIYSREMHEHAMAQLQMETDLRKAIENRELQVFYQPVLSIKSGQLVGFEALSRWNHPAKGWIPPALFIPLAEETGQITALGEWTLMEASRQLKLWQDLLPSIGKPWISVNISARQFADHSFVDTVRQAVAGSGLDPKCLVLEITESIVMQQAESTIELLRNLKELDVQLFVDDFGTGYSSLSYLHQFPIDALKIDHSFVQSIGKGSDTQNLAKAIIVLAHTLRLPVIAEGVETAEQRSKLLAYGCDYWQGNFVCPAKNSGAVEVFLEKHLCSPKADPSHA